MAQAIDKAHQSSRDFVLREEERERRDSTILGSLRSAVPIVANEASHPLIVANDWVASATKRGAKYGQEGPGTRPPSKERIGLFSILSFSTVKERWLMVFGLFWAFISGLSMPIWLLLLGQSLETFNELGALIKTVGKEKAFELLIDQLYQLCWSFAVVGLVSLIAGTLYVALWTYTGESQTTRIKDNFVRGAFRQEAAWFDKRGDPQELPTLAANALTRINDAIGRQMADTFSNLISSVCCLLVAFGLDAPLVRTKKLCLLE